MNTLDERRHEMFLKIKTLFSNKTSICHLLKDILMFYYIYFLVRALNVSHCSFYFTKMNKSLLKLSTLKKVPEKAGTK